MRMPDSPGDDQLDEYPGLIKPSELEHRHIPGRAELLATYPWVAFILPLVVFMVVGCFEPKPPTGEPITGWQLPYWTYPWVYTLKVALTTIALAAVWPAMSAFPRWITPWSVIVGVVGVVLWVGLWKLQLEKRLLEPLGLG